MIGRIVTIKMLPGVGECKINRSLKFYSGTKYAMTDNDGRTWHKLRTEIEITHKEA
jgi:hypothetical protein